MSDPRLNPNVFAAALREAAEHTEMTAADLRDAADEVERLHAEVAAFRRAVREGDGPSCEDVCLRECIGVCGAWDDSADWEG